MIRAALGVAVAGALGAAVGWLDAAPHPPHAVAAQRLHPPAVGRPGGEVADAARRLAAREAPPPAPQSIPSPTGRPAARDIALVLRDQVAAMAVDATTGAPYIVFVRAGAASRRLAPNDALPGGWRLVAIRRRSIIVRRGAAERQVALFTPADAP